MLEWTNKSGYDKHCERKDNAADNVSVHHVQEVVDGHRKPTKTMSHILLTRSLPQEGKYSEGQEYHEAE